MGGYDTYASHLNGIPLGLEHMRWTLTDIGRLIGRDDRQIPARRGPVSAGKRDSGRSEVRTAVTN